jgi:predicted dehydrogenase
MSDRSPTAVAAGAVTAPVLKELPTAPASADAPRAPSKTIRLAAIGFGSRISHMCRMICQLDDRIQVAAVADNRLAKARQWADEREIPAREKIHYLENYDELIERGGDFDGFLIGTPDHLHAPLAVRLAKFGKPLFLEKPVVISWRQHVELAAAWAGNEKLVLVSFPLRLTNHVQTAMRIVRSGRLGTISQIQAVDNVYYGGVFFGQWFREYEQTGGLWLQKATHDLDYITQLMQANPVQITAMHTRTVYGGEKPPALRCSACDETEVCMESPVNILRRGEDGGMLNYRPATPESDHDCAFSSSIKNQDAGSALVLYDNGAHAAFSQNFVSRRSAGKRGATVIGYRGTLSFEWDRDDVIKVIDHHRESVERIKVHAGLCHGGGDDVLAQNFVDLLRGRAESQCPLDQGLLSAAICLAARDSANLRQWQPIPQALNVGLSKLAVVEPSSST